MLINGTPYQSIWLNSDGWSVDIIDQTRLPYELVIVNLQTVADVERAIKDMLVRGAPLIGVTAAYGLCLQARVDASDAALEAASARLLATRPTAVNLRWAVQEMQQKLCNVPVPQRVAVAYKTAQWIRQEDIASCEYIGKYGRDIIRKIFDQKQSTINILTHCNAGWLAAVDWGTALAPIYAAHADGIPVHVWVDETRPRNQGASLTAYELGSHGIDHTVIADNVGGHLMQHGMVDLCIVGSDRCTNQGDVCNKIGTYLKALAAHANNVPFYAALPCSTIDWTIADGVSEIPIEERSGEEVTHISGVAADGSIKKVRIVPKEDTKVANYGFDVTPARYVTGIITDLGVFEANQQSLQCLQDRINKEDLCVTNGMTQKQRDTSPSM